MGRPFDRWLVLAIAAVAGGCGGHVSSTTPSEGSGGALGVGGQIVSGGTQTSGGATATGGAAVGDSPFASGGTSAHGGAHALGGTTSTVASPSGGDATVSGGTTTTGGAAIAGAGRSNGGANVIVGGHTGGNLATGGRSATGGVIVTGGTTPIGGASTGGISIATGGTLTTAGTKATGGANATGGAFSAAGSAAVWPKKFCGNITTGNSIEPAGLTFAKHWDQITPENAGKWAAVQSSPSTGAFNWSSLDSIYAYAEQNGILFKEHTFVWGAAQPIGQTPATLEIWIKAFCERYPKTALIDVVNEPPPHTTPTYVTALGQGETGKYPWITKSFKLARQYCANAVLILNDYGNIEYESQENHFIEIVQDIVAAGAPIDAVGAQAHDAYKLTTSQLRANLEKLATQTGLPVYITEYDVSLSSDAAQYDAYAAQFPVFWDASYVRGVTVWGWIMGRTWMTYSGLINGTTPRPAMTWLMGYLGRPSPP